MIRSFLVVALVMLAGCGSRTTPASESPASNLERIAMLYMAYMHSGGGVAPSNPEEFKRFIRTQGAETAKTLEIDLTRLDDLFISSRDGKLIIVNYGLQAIGSQTLPIIAYEAQGRDGMRMVAFVNGMNKEVDATTAAELGLKESS